jgi:hypothetical protein
MLETCSDTVHMSRGVNVYIYKYPPTPRERRKVHTRQRRGKKKRKMKKVITWVKYTQVGQVSVE